MRILAIETSADETAAAITSERKVLANVIFSQILLHKKWGGIYPSLAKRAHEERIDEVVEEVFKKVAAKGSKMSIKEIDYIAVTQGPGLAVALEVGIKKAKELAKKYHKKLIAVNHLEGHIYSCFVQNSRGNPKRKFDFPYLALIVSGGHTQIVLFENHLCYKVIGRTLDDAAGEALDKAAKVLGLGYPGGPVIERLADEVKNRDFYHFPRPMLRSNNLDFSFSGLKTAFFYFIKKKLTGEGYDKKKSSADNLTELASSYQSAVFETIVAKVQNAIKQTGVIKLLVGGGVSANLYLRRMLIKAVRKNNGMIFFPPFKYLTGDNASMIGVAAYYKAQRGLFVKEIERLDRIARLEL